MSIVGKSQSGRACAEPASRPSAPRSGGGAKRRALTSVSTRARCWLDDAAGDHDILRSTRVQFLSVPRARQHAADIRHLRSLPTSDVVAAGFPCKDLSQAGRTEGISGRHSGLIGEVFRLLPTVGKYPEWLVLENVPSCCS